MEKYHMRRPDREIYDTGEMREILERGPFMTLAMCKGNEPYLVSMDYVYSREDNCLFFHCARQGKKIAFLAENPNIWGEVVEDNGYIEGKCSHAYRSVHFNGKAVTIEDDAAIRRALIMLIDKYEKAGEDMKKKFIYSQNISSAVIRVDIEEMWGKKNDGTTD